MDKCMLIFSFAWRFVLCYSPQPELASVFTTVTTVVEDKDTTFSTGICTISYLNSSKTKTWLLNSNINALNFVKKVLVLYVNIILIYHLFITINGIVSYTNCHFITSFYYVLLSYFLSTTFYVLPSTFYVLSATF